MTQLRTAEIRTLDELVALVGEPGDRARNKGRAALLDVDRAWLAASPFVMVATADADGNCDNSPKGDPPGRLVHVIDEHTIAIPERPGNKRVDGYRNILTNPHVGLNFFIPGRGDTLRINGRARLLVDVPYLDELMVRGQRPILVLEVTIDDIFFHCAKAFLRSRLWDPQTWEPTETVPRRAVIAAQVEPDGRSVAELDSYYGPSYEQGLY